MTKVKVKTQKVNAHSGLDIAQANASHFNTLSIYFTLQSSMTKNPATIATWYREQMEEAIHQWNKASNHTDRNYWQGYATAMKQAMHKLQKDFIHEDTTY